MLDKCAFDDMGMLSFSNLCRMTGNGSTQLPKNWMMILCKVPTSNLQNKIALL